MIESSDVDSVSPFEIFRQEGYPTLYADLAHKVWIDVLLFRLSFLFFAIFVSFFAILPGFRGKQRWFVLFRWLPVIVIGYLLIFCNWMPLWETGHLDVRVPYRTGSNAHINASIGMYVGLRGMNITLKGLPPQQNDQIIDYNEHFSWTWQQGKPGFGYDAGPLNKEYQHAQLRGLPLPILWIVETFTIDYEYVRIGRYYRQSGWFAHIFLWLSIPLFVLANILFQMVIQYGSLFMIFTGMSLLMSNLIVTFSKSVIPFKLAFTEIHSQESQFLTLHFSYCYYINLINGIICILIGLATLIADLRCPDETAAFFGNDILQSYEDYFADPHQKTSCGNSNGHLSQPIKHDNEVLLRRKPLDVSEQNSQQEMAIASGLKKRAISNRFSRFQKSTLRKLVMPSVTQALELRMQSEAALENASSDEEMPLYENYQHFDTIREETEL